MTVLSYQLESLVAKTTLCIILGNFALYINYDYFLLKSFIKGNNWYKLCYKPVITGLNYITYTLEAETFPKTYNKAVILMNIY